MKRLYFIFLFAAGLTLFQSCDKDEMIVLDESATMSFSLSVTNMTLTEATSNQTATVASFIEPNVGFDAAPLYRVYFDFANGDFTDAVYIDAGSSISRDFTVIEINDALIDLGISPLVPTNIDVKAAAIYGSKIIYSNEVQITVMAFPTEYPNLFLVGDATAAGWDNNNNNYPMFKDPVLAGRYYYTGYFAAGSVKLLEIKGQWQPQWGKGSTAGTLAVNPGGGTDPDVISIPSSGYYTLFVDLVNLTFTLTSYDATASTVYPTIGILGAATPTGWDSDTDMIQSSFDPHIWFISSITLNQSAGGDCDCGFKFRANNGWDVNWGGATNPPTLNHGIGSLGGKNIGVPATGNYLVFFNDLDMRYFYILN